MAISTTNLAKILEIRGLVGRAGDAIVLLIAVLIVSTLVLVPDQPRAALGTELLVTGLLQTTRLDARDQHVLRLGRSVSGSPRTLFG